VRSNFDRFRACYEDALWRKGDATGRVQLRFVIDEAGNVVNSCVEPPVFGDGEAVDCILAELNRVEFGTGDRLTIVYPIVLIPEK
jgi:hypothetical protein